MAGALVRQTAGRTPKDANRATKFQSGHSRTAQEVRENRFRRTLTLPIAAGIFLVADLTSEYCSTLCERTLCERTHWQTQAIRKFP